MGKTYAFLKLIRYKNLLIILWTMMLVRYCLLRPMVAMVFQNVNITLHLQMSELNFMLLCLSVLFIAAAGYAINDYFDIRIDRINKPDKIIVGRFIQRRVVMGMHIVLTIVGLLLAAWVSYSSGLWKLTGIHLFAVISLWFYSTHFKRKLLMGNIIIAFMASLIPLLPAIYEIPMLDLAYYKVLRAYHANFNFILGWIASYAVFAFLITLAREITKDMMDIKGDEKTGCSTVPVIWGFKKSKQIVAGIYLIILFLVFFLWEKYLIGEKTFRGDLIRFDTASFLYILLFILLPLLWLIYKMTVTVGNQFLKLSATVNKVIAVAGTMYMMIAWYTITHGLIL